MTAGTALPPEAAAYLEDVREALADLPEAERDDLLDELEPSLLAAAEEGGSVAARLGPPEEFAAELRSAAGLHETPAPPARPSRIGVAMRAFAADVARHPGAITLRRLGRELAPIWWVVRAYLAVGVVAYVFDWQWSARFAFVPRIGTAEIGIAVILVAVVASVWLGLKARRHGVRTPRLAAAVNLALLAAAIPVTAEVATTASYDVLVAMAYAPTPEPAPLPPGLVYDGEPVDNIYPYSREGKLLRDVLLYDGAGRPLEIPGNRVEDPDRRFVVTNGNRPLFNTFPLRYFEPGTKRVARPNAAPYVELPLVLTPPLPERASRR